MDVCIARSPARPDERSLMSMPGKVTDIASLKANEKSKGRKDSENEAAPMLRRASYSGFEGYRDLFDRNPAPLYVVALGSLEVLTCNAAAVEQYGYPYEVIIGMTFPELLGSDHRNGFAERFAQFEGVAPERLERHRTADGTEFDAIVSSVTVEFENKPARLVMATDATRRLVHRAHFDPLTDLPNRGMLLDRLVRALARAALMERSVAVLSVDIDRFASVNDALGHSGGDVVITTVARRLSAHLESGDLLARTGADEFIVVVEGLTRSEDAHTTAERLRNAVTTTIRVGDSEVYVSASIGVAGFPHDGTTADELLRNADAALHLAKSRGGGAIEIFTPELRKSAAEAAAIEAGLRAALDRGELEPWYQPIVDSTTGRLVALEALARWRHPELGILAGIEFIHVAESTGLIVKLGELILRRSCTALKRWNEKLSEPIRVSVNVSARQLLERGFPKTVQRALDASGLPPSLLQLEITESAYIGGTGMAIANIRALEAMQVRLSIDDFGTGFSSLGYLKRFPAVDTLKIDRSFVREITTDSTDQAISRAIIAVAQNLSLKVVAEGVETKEQAELLQQLGCQYLQGFYFSKPLREFDVAAFVERHAR
jgi:diguanylate cyclase (GGDEF)-like protein/PAS domain S-box-containing protein